MPYLRLSDFRRQPSVAIIGGGVAGLAAAVAAVEHGFHVELFEQAPTPGGRAGSYHDAQADQLVDLSPHVAMGCCTNLLDFCRRTETADGFDRYATLHFFGPDGRRYDFAASRWLPAPLHLLPGLRRLGYLTGRERRAIGRAMLRLARHREPDAADAPTMGEWLRRQKQPENAVRRFWAVVLESALGDTLDRVSVAAARKVFVDGFMATREAYEVLVPRIPLGEIWQRAGTWLTRRGAKLHMRTRIERLEVDGRALPRHRAGRWALPPLRPRRLGRLLETTRQTARPGVAQADPPGRGRHRAELLADHGGASLVRSADHGPASCRLGRPAEPVGVQ